MTRTSLAENFSTFRKSKLTTLVILVNCCVKIFRSSPQASLPHSQLEPPAVVSGRSSLINSASSDWVGLTALARTGLFALFCSWLMNAVLILIFIDYTVNEMQNTHIQLINKPYSFHADYTCSHRHDDKCHKCLMLPHFLPSSHMHIDSNISNFSSFSVRHTWRWQAARRRVCNKKQWDVATAAVSWSFTLLVVVDAQVCAHFSLKDFLAIKNRLNARVAGRRYARTRELYYAFPHCRAINTKDSGRKCWHAHTTRHDNNNNNIQLTCTLSSATKLLHYAVFCFLARLALWRTHQLIT